MPSVRTDTFREPWTAGLRHSRPIRKLPLPTSGGDLRQSLRDRSPRHSSRIPVKGAQFGGLHPTRRASLMSQLVKNLPAMQETQVRSLGWEDPPGEGNGYPLQYPGLENSMDFIVHGVTKSRTRLSNFHFHPTRQGRARAGVPPADSRLRLFPHFLPVSSASAPGFQTFGESGVWEPHPALQSSQYRKGSLALTGLMPPSSCHLPGRPAWMCRLHGDSYPGKPGEQCAG